MPTKPFSLLPLLLHLVVTSSSISHAQSISVDSVPPYAVLGFITGTVTGVDPSTHHVAIYIQIEGSGWWTKPSLATPTVPIDLAGKFSADVGTGGPASLDSRATIFCAALLPETTTPDPAAGAGRIPASLVPLAIDCKERYGRTLQFAGHSWAVKESPLPVGPGLNPFSDRAADVFVDQDGLHLRVGFHQGEWWSTEVILLTHLGHGSYLVQTDSRLDDLDANVTLGMFTWDAYGDEETVPGAANREIDFEDSRWTDASDPTNAQMVVQPYSAPDNLRRYSIPDLSTAAALTRFFTWSPDQIEFTALLGHHMPSSFPPASLIDQYFYLHGPPSHHVPTPGREYFRINLWLNNVVLGSGSSPEPAGGLPVEVVITDVVYVPEAGKRLLISSGVGTLIALSRRRRARLHEGQMP